MPTSDSDEEGSNLHIPGAFLFSQTGDQMESPNSVIGFVPLSDTCQILGMKWSRVWSMLHERELVGKKVKGRWFVSEESIRQLQGALMPKTRSERATHNSNQPSPED
jgi:hypothetical protein